LGQHDAERVGDEERSDDQTGSGQRQQHDAQVADGLLGSVGAGRCSVLTAGDRVVAAEGCGQSGTQVGHGSTVGGNRFDRAEAGSEPEQSLGGRQVGQQHVAVGQPVAVTDAGQADDAQSAAGRGGHRDGVADLDVLGSGGCRVEDDLVGAGGGVAGAERVRGER
jgi:hypothetical protein